ncbi:MAG: hypothetical protein M0042_08570 [Nitrospiraceae bacterium]|nr:hypothetical protein [Nitrospiraceae bacterium]
MAIKRTIGGIPVFIVLVALLIGVLELANWIPLVIQDGALERFASIDEARNRLKRPDILSPAYYPRSVRWPPILVAAQDRPYRAILAEFSRTEGNETVLAITQTERGRPPLRTALHLASVRERAPFEVKGRRMLLEAGSCPSGDPCSRLSWIEGTDDICIVMKDAAPELVRIAESMMLSRAMEKP